MSAWDSLKNDMSRRIILELGKKECTPGELVETLGVSKVAIARNLRTLKEYKLVKIRRDGQRLYYSLHLENYTKHAEATIELGGENFKKAFHLSNKSEKEQVKNSLQDNKKIVKKTWKKTALGIGMTATIIGIIVGIITIYEFFERVFGVIE